MTTVAVLTGDTGSIPVVTANANGDPEPAEAPR